MPDDLCDYLEPLTPIIVPHGIVTAFLYHGLDPERVLKTLRSTTFHLTLRPGDPIGAALEAAPLVCCSACGAPWTTRFSVFTMDEEFEATCACGAPQARANVLDLTPADGTAALLILKSGRNYYGVGPALVRLGDICKRLLPG